MLIVDFYHKMEYIMTLKTHKTVVCFTVAYVTGMILCCVHFKRSADIAST